MISQEVGDWIAEHVLPKRYVKGCGGLDNIRLCACQFGRCGHCSQLGKHEDCTTKAGWGGQPPATNMTWLSHVPVNTVGKPCVWRCPCPCPEPVVEAKPVEPVNEQLGLFDLPA